MSLSSWFSWTLSRSHARRGRRRNPAPRPKTACLFLELLESRVTPSFGLSNLALFNGTNGGNSEAGLIMDGSGNLYGTASTGGANGDGTIFELAKGSDALTTLASFNGTNGAGPLGGLIMDSSGNLYGTADSGGANGDGTIFELAKGSGALTTLDSFNDANGPYPQGSMIMDSSGNLYGTISCGGASDAGTVFELAQGSRTLTTLGSFNGTNGLLPYGSLVMDSSGNLYGTASQVLGSSFGTVFELAQGSGTITALATFNGTDGANPYGGLIMDSSGNLYGTTEGGGASNKGTVFELAQGSGTITTLTSFNGTNGGYPYGGLIMDSNGNLYGTTQYGPTVFELAKGSSSVTNLASFNGTDGAVPQCTLIMDSSCNLYGTAEAGGAANEGTVFELLPHTPALSWTPASIIAGTALDSTELDASAADSVSGAAVPGTFVYTPAAGTILPPGWQTLSVTFTPADTADYSPITTMAPILVSQFTPVLTWSTPAAIIAGTPLSSTQLDASGATDPNTGAAVAGTFVYTPAAGTILPFGSQTLNVTFTPADTTEYTAVTKSVTLVVTPVTPVLTWDTPAPISYGTPLSSVQLDASAADPNTGSPVSGTFVYTPAAGTILLRGSTILTATFTPTDTTVYTTAQASVTLVVTPSYSVDDLASPNGAYPEAGLLMDSSGNLYGTTSHGGANGYGSVFELAKGSSSVTTLASFNGTNGAYPAGALIMDSSGNLYGTTDEGGPTWNPWDKVYGYGTVFELAHGKGKITTLASFPRGNGANPQAGLVMDSSGNLYGTTSEEGGNGIGSVFELAKGSSSVTTLASFNGTNGAYPAVALIMDSSGNLYGTTTLGGTGFQSVYEPGNGMVFELAKGNSGTFTFATLASFNGTDGAYPYGGLIMDGSGNLYGTSEYGGIGYVPNSSNMGDGTVFELAKGSRTITPLALFSGANGEAPRAGLIMDSSGNLYGTTSGGSASSDGTVFELAQGSGTITTLTSFNGTDGADPLAGLIMDTSGNLYGTTQYGGASSDGTVFELPGAVAVESFQISGIPSSTSAGTPQTFTITVQNADGTTDTSYTGTVAFTSTDAQAVLPANYTFTAANAGVATFTATLKTAGTQSFTATDTEDTNDTGSDTIAVTPAAASSLSIGGFPSPTKAGRAANVTVTALDAYGNIATGYTGTVHFTSSDAQAVLPADFTFTAADAGQYVFSATLKTAGAQALTVADTVNSGLTSTQTGITVKPAAASVLVIIGPATETAGVAFSITVTAYDAYGNVATGYTGTVHFKSTDTTASLPANYTFLASDTGTHTFSGIVLKTKGIQSITAKDTLTSTITGSLGVDVS